MPVYRFKGFASGSAVALSAAQGTATDNASVANWGQIHAGSVSVSVARSDWRVAPETIAFAVSGYSGFVTPEPSGTFDERFHDFAFLWDFGDPGATFQVPERLPVQHRDANVGYGPAVAHTYRPGNYTASVLVVELSSGRTAYWEQPIAVADPDVFFAGKTITVNPDGGANHTTLYAALDAAAAATDVRRIQLARGKTYDLSGDYRFDKVWRNVYISAASGAGAKPILNRVNVPEGDARSTFISMASMGRTNGGTKLDFIMDGLVLKGQWDPTIEGGGGWIRWFFFWPGNAVANAAPPDYFQLHDCSFDGVGLLIQGAAAESTIFSNCDCTNWMDYGLGLMGSDTSRLVILGTKTAQNQNAIGGGTKDFRHNMHGPIRIGKMPLAIVDGCDFFSNNGWFPNTSGYRTVQSAFRWAQDGGVATEGNRLNMQRSILEGGFEIFGSADASGAATVGNHNARIEKCYFLGSHMTRAMIALQFGGYTIRNNVMVHPNPAARPPGPFGVNSWLRIRSPGVSSSQDMARILMEHNQLVNLQVGTSTRPVFEYDTTPFPQNVVVRNNVIHQPSTTAPQTDFAPLDATPVITPLTIGYQRRLEVFTGTLSASVPPGGFIDVPYASGDFGNGTEGSYQVANATHTFNLAGPVTFTLNATSVRVTNTGSTTWNAGQSWTMELERNVANLPPLSTQFATPVGSGALFGPLLGSPALGLAEEADIRDDYFGSLRPQMSSYGALEAQD